ncbi:MAG: hypothetical protein ACREYE_13435 [Gammaproteobacteria bacterium]
MTAPVLRALAFGVGILLLADAMWVMVLMSTTYPTALAWALQSSPAITAFTVAYLAPRKKILLGMSMVIFAASLASAAKLVYGALGLPTDLPGIRGARIVFTIALVSGSILCAIGTAAGYFLSRKHTQPGMTEANTGS